MLEMSDLNVVGRKRLGRNSTGYAGARQGPKSEQLGAAGRL
jgi:hypothetical protein